jgi:hypothetical protein
LSRWILVNVEVWLQHLDFSYATRSSQSWNALAPTR